MRWEQPLSVSSCSAAPDLLVTTGASSGKPARLSLVHLPAHSEAPVPELHCCFSALISFNQTSLWKYLPWTSWFLCAGVVRWWSCFDLSTPLPYYTYMWVPLFMEILLERISSACSAVFLQACLLPLLIWSEPYHLSYQHLPSLDSWSPLHLPQNLKTTASLSPM